MNDWGEPEANKWVQLVRELVAKTRRGTLEWRQTDQPDEFLLARRSATVSLSSQDSDGRFPFVLELRTPEGQLVDGIIVTHAPAQFEQNVAALYQLARENARGTTNLLNDLLEELGEEA
jgi:hypothetical protein